VCFSSYKVFATVTIPPKRVSTALANITAMPLSTTLNIPKTAIMKVHSGASKRAIAFIASYTPI